MARKLPAKDVAIVGLGWTGSILAYELADEGLDVVAIERGPWRDTATDFPPSYAPDELRYRIRHELFLRPAQVSLTFRNNINQTALPVREWGAFMLGNGAGGAAFTGTPRPGGSCRAISALANSVWLKGCFCAGVG